MFTNTTLQIKKCNVKQYEKCTEKKLKNYKKVKMHALKTNAGPTVSVTFF